MTERARGRPLPTGTVTFLRTDVEGSMVLARELGARWDSLNETHLDLLRDAVERHGGVRVRTEGDALFAAFGEAGAAVQAAIEGQRAITDHPWPDDGVIRVRMTVHTGEGHLAGDDYGGFDVNRVARIAAVGHGGQLIVSGTTEALVATSLPAGCRMRPLGRFVLRDIPTPETLFQVDIPGLRTDFPPLRVARPTRGNIPERVTSFVGRSADLDQLGSLLDENRLVTLTGPGGIGKTSLAIEVARRRADAMPDGAWLVALDAVTDPEQVGAAIARALGLFDGAEGPAADALPAFLAERAGLVVLDNFEHLLAAAGEVAGLVRASPGSRFIVTSRAPLRVAGEQEYPVRPLSVGDAAGSAGAANARADAAVHLFTDRARSVAPDWTPGQDEPVVAEICTLLDGLPLGIELAAARMSVLPASAIRDRLVAHLPLPGPGPRDAPARQRTLEGAIAWSYDLLSADERRVLQMLAVFEGGFDATQAGEVIEGGATDGPRVDVLEALIALAEHSLITRGPRTGGPGETASGIRFGLMTTVQDFALQRLREAGEEHATRKRHALAYLALAETAAGHLWTAGQAVWLDRLAVDHPNLRAALRWSIETGEVEMALRLLAALWRFWQLDGHIAEGNTWAHAALALPGADEPTPARLGALAAAGGIAYWRGEREESRALYSAQLALAEKLSDVPATADAYFNLAAANFVSGDTSESLRCDQEAHRLYVELGDEVGANRANWGAANMAYNREGPAASLGAIIAVHERSVELGDAVYEALTSASIAWTYDALGDTASAAAWAIDSMVGSYGLRDLGSTAIGLPVGALVALQADRPEDAAVIMGTFEECCQRYGMRPPMGLADLIRRSDPLGRIATSLDPDVMAAATERGRRTSLGEAVALIEQIGHEAGWRPVTSRPGVVARVTD
jgi:predicted ATPase/class 3 adenylate cyclase